MCRPSRQIWLWVVSPQVAGVLHLQDPPVLVTNSLNGGLVLLMSSAGRWSVFIFFLSWWLFVFQKHICKRKKWVAEKLHGRLHLWITGLQGAQAEPFKAGHNFAAVNAAKRNKNTGYSLLVSTNSRVVKEQASSEAQQRTRPPPRSDNDCSAHSLGRAAPGPPSPGPRPHSHRV